MNIKDIIKDFNIPSNISIDVFKDIYFNDILKLYESEKWMSFVNRPEDALEAWKNSQIALVILRDNKVIGFIRGVTDQVITTYICEVLISTDLRGLGLGKTLIEVCHRLYPKTRIDLLSSEEADEFYKNNGFREITGFRKSFYR